MVRVRTGFLAIEEYSPRWERQESNLLKPE
jgi:hypothetical protein